MYKRGDCITKVYGKAKAGKVLNGRWQLEVEHSNKVYLDLHKDNYGFRSKALIIEPKKIQA